MENTAKSAVVPQYIEKIEINDLVRKIQKSIWSWEAGAVVDETIDKLREMGLLREDRIDFGQEPLETIHG